MPGIKEIMWTDNSYSPQALIRKYNNSFPVIIHVTKGYFGTNEIETVSTDQVARVHGYVIQSRVVAEDISGDLLSIPLDYPVKLHVREAKKGKRPRPKHLKEILRQYNLPVNAVFDIQGSRRGSIRFGYKEIKTAKYGEITILGIKDVTFLLTNTIHDGVIDRMVSLIPTYLDYDMRVATSLKEGENHDWENLNGMYNRAVSHINYRTIKGVSDIMVITQPFTPITPPGRKDNELEEGQARARINGVAGGTTVTDFSFAEVVPLALKLGNTTHPSNESPRVHRSTIQVSSDVTTEDSHVTSGLGSDVSSLSLSDYKTKYGKSYLNGPPSYQAVAFVNNSEQDQRKTQNQMFKTTVDLSPGSPPDLVAIGSRSQQPYFTGIPALRHSSSADNINVLSGTGGTQYTSQSHDRESFNNRQGAGLMQPMRSTTMPRYGMVTMYEDGHNDVHYNTLSTMPSSHRMSRSLTDLRFDMSPEVYRSSTQTTFPRQYADPNHGQYHIVPHDGRYRKSTNPSRTMSTSSASRKVRLNPNSRQHLDVPDGGVYYGDQSDEEHYSFRREHIRKERRNHPVLSSPNPSRRNKSSSSYSQSPTYVERTETPPQYSVIDTETGHVSYQVDPGYIERQVHKATMEAGRNEGNRQRRMESVESYDTMDSYYPASQVRMIIT